MDPPAAATSGASALSSGTNTTQQQQQQQSLLLAQTATALWQKQPKANAEFVALTYGALIQELLHDLEDAQAIQQTLESMGHSMGLRCLEELLAKSAVLQMPVIGNSNTDASLEEGFAEAMGTVKVAFKVFFGIAVDLARLTKADLQQQLLPQSSSSTSQAIPTTSPDKSATAGFAITFTENPLAIFVSLPEEDQDETSDFLEGGSNEVTSMTDKNANSGSHTRPSLVTRFEYSELLCGWARGLLEALGFDCTCRMDASMLQPSTAAVTAASSSMVTAVANRSAKPSDRYQISVFLNQVIREGAGADYQEE